MSKQPAVAIVDQRPAVQMDADKLMPHQPLKATTTRSTDNRKPVSFAGESHFTHGGILQKTTLPVATADATKLGLFGPVTRPTSPDAAPQEKPGISPVTARPTGTVQTTR